MAAAFTAGHGFAAGISATEPLVYSGTLLDTAGSPLTGTHDLEIRFWNSAAAATGQLCATAGASVGLQVGRFSLPLPEACTDAVRGTPDVWVEVVVDDAVVEGDRVTLSSGNNSSFAVCPGGSTVVSGGFEINDWNFQVGCQPIISAPRDGGWLVNFYSPGRDCETNSFHAVAVCCTP